MAQETVEFRKMIEDEFSHYLESSLESYAQDRARNFKRPIEEERTVARQQVKNILKNGINTKGHFLFNVVARETGDTVGYVWVYVDETTWKKKLAFLYDIIIQERFRGRGYGRKTLELVEAKLREMNVASIGLHVFADNAVAINLYKTQGYYTASFNMQKDL